jgi:predicted phosphodiesterase
MPVAAIYDIHANLPALEAVLQDIRRADVDQVVVGGDVVPGPMPRETIECLLDLDIPVQFIQGDGEVDVLAEMAGAEVSRVPEQFREVVHWSALQLRAGHEQLLANWPPTCRLGIRGLGEALFCHATSRSDTEIFTRLTPKDRLLPVFEGLSVPVVVCGHTHMQFERTIEKIRVVNAGSVGMPFGGPGAYWLLLGPDIQFQRTAYDLAKAAERIRATNYPQAQDFAARNILQPPSEREMLEAFSKLDMRVV